MKEIIFATGNTGKFHTLSAHLKKYGLAIDVVQKPLELIEPQANTVEEVVRVKAQQAYEQLRRPVLVDDSSFHIEALGGFPGPYIKYMMDTVGEEGIVRFMQSEENRRAYFMSALVFVDKNGEFHEFSSRDVQGEIADFVDDFDHPRAWSGLWKVFSPDGYDKTLSRFTEAEHAKRHSLRNENDSAYEQFMQWLKKTT